MRMRCRMYSLTINIGKKHGNDSVRKGAKKCCFQTFQTRKLSRIYTFHVVSCITPYGHSVDFDAIFMIQRARNKNQTCSCFLDV